MTAETLLELYGELRRQGLTTWIDGGWGVDALLGEETRSHQDVDLVVQEIDLERLVGVLRDKGYGHAEKSDTRPWNFVMQNAAGEEVDIHVINFDQHGNGIYGPPEDGQAYPASAFSGRGTIDGQDVLCMSVKYQMENHTGYELRDKDRQDVRRLREKFGV